MFPWISTLTFLSLPCSLTHSFSLSMSLWFRRFPLCHSRRCVDSRVHFALRWAVSPRLGWYLFSFPISLSQSQPIFQSISVFLSLSVPSQGLVGGGISCGHRVCYRDITSWRRVGVNFFSLGLSSVSRWLSQCLTCVCGWVALGFLATCLVANFCSLTCLVAIFVPWDFSPSRGGSWVCPGCSQLLRPSASLNFSSLTP